MSRAKRGESNLLAYKGRLEGPSYGCLLSTVHRPGDCFVATLLAMTTIAVIASEAHVPSGAWGKQSPRVQGDRLESPSYGCLPSTVHCPPSAIEGIASSLRSSQ